MQWLLACCLMGLVAGCAAGPPAPRPSSPSRRIPVVMSTRFSYRLTLRDPAWRPMRASALSPAADLALEHAGSDARVLVFAERTDRSRLDDFVRHSRSYVRLVAGAGANWTSAETARVAAGTRLVPAWLVERLVERWQQLRYFTLVTLVDGVGYNVLCWGSAHNPSLSATCRQLFGGFHIEWPEREPLDFLSYVPEAAR